MALDAYLKPQGKRITKETLRELKRKKLIMDRPGGTSKVGMKKAIKSLGFACREIPGKKKESRLKSIDRILALDHPIILGCNIRIRNKPYQHYVVLVGKDNHSQILHIHDPYPKSKYSRIKIDDFATRGNDLSWGTKMWGIEVFRRD
jgi:hypothetical protein